MKNRLKSERKEQPLVSVVIPVYNAGAFLRDALDSIINQTYRNIMIYIMDGGSTDQTSDIINDFRSIDDRIVLYKGEHLGLTPSLNALIDISGGKYIARMDADDVACKDRIEKQVRYMEQHPDIAVLGTKVQIIGSREYLFYEKFECDEARSIRLLFKNAGVAHPTAFFRRAFLEQNKIKYDEKCIAAEDYKMWCDVVNKGGRIHSLNNRLLYYRIHEGQLSDVNRDKDRIVCEYSKRTLLSRFGEFSDEEVKTLNRFCFWYEQVNYKLAFHLFRKLILCNKENELYDEQLFENELAFQWCYTTLLRFRTDRSVIQESKLYFRKLFPQASRIYIIKNIWWVSRFHRKSNLISINIKQKIKRGQ